MNTTAYTLMAFMISLVSSASLAQNDASQNEIPKKEKKIPLLKRLDHFSLAISSSHTAMPFGRFSRLITEEHHPGIEIGTGLNWKTGKKHDWIQTIQFQYSYHRFIQHSFMLYSEGGYRYKLPKGIGLTGKLGLGYMLVIEDSKVFELNDKGVYEQRSPGRSHMMADLSFIADKTVGKKGLRIFLNYQQRFQFRFIDDYVPVLPVNAALLGVSFPLRKS